MPISRERLTSCRCPRPAAQIVGIYHVGTPEDGEFKPIMCRMRSSFELLLLHSSVHTTLTLTDCTFDFQKIIIHHIQHSIGHARQRLYTRVYLFNAYTLTSNALFCRGTWDNYCLACLIRKGRPCRQSRYYRGCEAARPALAHHDGVKTEFMSKKKVYYLQCLDFQVGKYRQIHD